MARRNASGNVAPKDKAALSNKAAHNKHPLSERTMMRLSGLGPCQKCKKPVGTIGFWLGVRYGEGVTCDRCALGWIEPPPITDAEAMSRYGMLGCWETWRRGNKTPPDF